MKRQKHATFGLLSAALLFVFACSSLSLGAEAPPFTVEQNVAVPMRDGVVLRADVFRPTAPGPHPVLVGARSGADGTKTKVDADRLWQEGEDKRLLSFLPWLELPRNVFEDEADAVNAWLRDPHRDPWKLLDGCSDVGVPNLDITSSDFPNYDRNHNTAADQNADARLVAAEQTIHHGGTKASRLILPVIRGETE